MQAAKKKGGAPAKAPEPTNAAPEKKEEVAEVPAPAAETGGKKKKIPAHLLQIQKQQEALRKRQEEEARLDAEAKARTEEEERLAAEEEKRREEAKAIRKQKEKERIEQLKKEGKFLTKAQKEERARNELKLQQMLAAGIKVGPQVGEGGKSEKKAKPVYDKKKKNKAQQKVCGTTPPVHYFSY